MSFLPLAFSLGEECPFWLAGKVRDDGDVIQVRLTNSSGHVLEDRIEQGFVLFLTDWQAQRSVEVELFSRPGMVVDKRPFTDYFPAVLFSKDVQQEE
jgi:hypothetical protein